MSYENTRELVEEILDKIKVKLDEVEEILGKIKAKLDEDAECGRAMLEGFLDETKNTKGDQTMNEHDSNPIK